MSTTSMFIGEKIPGYNTDRIDVAAGVKMAKELGFTSAENIMVVEFALKRWARGEESAAMGEFRYYGFGETSGYAIVAAARAEGERTAKESEGGQDTEACS